MRYGILADVHANLHALKATLAYLARRGAERYLVPGDLVNYGPHPNECVELIAGLDAICVAGNHDLMAIEALGDENCGPLGREAMAWTRPALSADTRAFLAGLPLVERAPGGVVLVHATLDDTEERIESSGRAVEELRRLRDREPDARVLVCGHTHHRLFVGGGRRPFRPGRRRIGRDAAFINPGAVGQSREVRVLARTAILDTERREVELRALRYDFRGCREALRERGLPEACYHYPLSRFGPLGPPARRTLDRARRLMP